VLDMGEPVKIVDLAKNLIKLSDQTEDEIKIEYTGIRPGEKMYEELLGEDEILPGEVYDKIYVGRTIEVDCEKIENLIEQCKVMESEKLKEIMMRIVHKEQKKVFDKKAYKGRSVVMNIGIIGCGFIAKKHASAIEAIEGANLIAVSDKIVENMDYYKNEYGADGYENSEEMLQRDDLDIVAICTPTGLHAKLAIQVAEAGKHVILEKPIAMNLEDTDKIIEACKNNNVKLSVVHPNRYRPVVKELKQIIDSGSLGKIS